MSEWQSTTLSEVCTTITYGYTASANLNGIGPKFLRITDIVPNQINWDSVPNCVANNKDIEKYKLRDGDIVIARTGATTGYNKYIKNLKHEAVFASYLIRYQIDTNKAFPEFVGHILQSSNWYDYVDAIAGGSAQPGANAKQLGSFVLDLPPIEEQKAIASVLSSLDDKIDLLHRQNTTLERMAETLFRQWFVEEAQEDWDEVALGDVAIVQNGYAFSSSDYAEFQEGFLEVFKMGHIQPGGGLRFNPKADFVPRIEKLKRWTLNKNDIVMAMTDMKDNMGILGHPALIDVSDKYVLNQRVARIYLESTEKLKSIYLLYLQLNTEEAITLLQSKANSGVQVNLTTEAIKSIPISLPPESVQYKVLSNIEPIFDKLSSNRLAVKTLEKLRDTLLPKLMSGEVRINL